MDPRNDTSSDDDGGGGPAVQETASRSGANGSKAVSGWDKVRTATSYKQKINLASKIGRGLVAAAQQKVRYKEDGFDLDLTYIVPGRCIAMSFPASGVETVYRNSAKDVAAFLTEKHGDKFMIMNVADKTYGAQSFQNQVFDFGWPDHLAPPLYRLCQAVQIMHNWNKQDRDNVVCVHCKGGKGRTGVVIVAYMLMAKIIPDTDENMMFFQQMRFKGTSKKAGITGMGQREYVRYFDRVIRGELEVRNKEMYLETVTISPVPNMDKNGGCRPVLRIYKFDERGFNISEIFQYPSGEGSDTKGITLRREKFSSKIDPAGRQQDEMVILPIEMMLTYSDVIIKCGHCSRKGKNEQSNLRDIFRAQFNTMAINGYKLVLRKENLDDTDNIDNNTTVTLTFSESKTLADSSKLNDGAGLARDWKAEETGEVAAQTKRDIAAVELLKMNMVNPKGIEADDEARGDLDSVRRRDSKRVLSVRMPKKGSVKAFGPDSIRPASQLHMPEEQRVAIMQQVKDGILSQDEAVTLANSTEKALENERRLSSGFRFSTSPDQPLEKTHSNDKLQLGSDPICLVPANGLNGARVPPPRPPPPPKHARSRSSVVATSGGPADIFGAPPQHPGHRRHSSLDNHNPFAAAVSISKEDVAGLSLQPGHLQALSRTSDSKQPEDFNAPFDPGTIQPSDNPFSDMQTLSNRNPFGDATEDLLGQSQNAAYESVPELFSKSAPPTPNPFLSVPAANPFADTVDEISPGPLTPTPATNNTTETILSEHVAADADTSTRHLLSTPSFSDLLGDDGNIEVDPFGDAPARPRSSTMEKPPEYNPFDLVAPGVLEAAAAEGLALQNGNGADVPFDPFGTDSPVTSAGVPDVSDAKCTKQVMIKKNPFPLPASKVTQATGKKAPPPIAPKSPRNLPPAVARKKNTPPPTAKRI